LPINVLDNQFLDKGLIKKFSARGMALQARSIFLQGALLMDRYEFLDFFNGKYIKIHEEFNYFLQKNNLDALSFCLSWAIRNPQISQIVLGVNSNHQLKELINTDMLQVNKLPSIETEDIQSFLDPRQWNSF
jgi:aryl-alcohol dehydrogenase-like predicted oxidoreductase